MYKFNRKQWLSKYIGVCFDGEKSGQAYKDFLAKSPIKEKKETAKDWYVSVCCGAKVKYEEDKQIMYCTRCGYDCSLTLTKAGVEASVKSSHSLSYPTPTQSFDNKVPEKLDIVYCSRDLTTEATINCLIKKVDKILDYLSAVK
jgi:hypothetical protein